MKAIEKEMVSAVKNVKHFKKSNTAVYVVGNIVMVKLFGNLIYAKNTTNGKEMFSDGGWRSVTTKSRLNAAGCYVYQKNWAWFNPDGTPWVNGRLRDIY